MAQGVFSSLADIAVGRVTPIGTGLTAAEEAEQRRKLAAALVDVAESESSITVAHKNLMQEGVESWSGMQVAVAQVYGDLIQASAEYAGAQAADRQAYADFIGSISSSPEMQESSDYIFGKLVPEEMRTAFTNRVEQDTRAAVAGIDATQQSNYFITSDGALSEKTQTILDTIIQSAKTQLDEDIGNLDGPGNAAARGAHEDAAIQQTMDAISTVLTAAELSEGLDRGDLNNEVQLRRALQTLPAKGFGARVQQDDREAYNSGMRKAAENLEELASSREQFREGGLTGIGGLSQRAESVLSAIRSNTGNDPYAWLEGMPKTEMPEGIGQAKAMLMAEFARLNAPDPLNAAVAELRAGTPGFDLMRESMGFRRDEDLAIYFQRNPEYYRDVMTAVRKAQESGDTEFKDMLDLMDTAGMSRLLDTAGQIRTATDEEMMEATPSRSPSQTLPAEDGSGLPDEAPAQNQEQGVPPAETPLDPSFFLDNTEDDLDMGARLSPPQDPNLRYASVRRKKLGESTAQIQQDLQKRLGRILTPPTGDDTPPTKNPVV